MPCGCGGSAKTRIDVIGPRPEPGSPGESFGAYTDGLEYEVVVAGAVVRRLPNLLAAETFARHRGAGATVVPVPRA